MSGPVEPSHRDEGMSLVEVLVATGMFMVLTTMILSVTVLGLRTSTGMQVRLDNSTQGDLGMAAAGKVLRTAVLPDQLDDQACDGCADTAIVAASSTKITFYANLDNTGLGPTLTTLETATDRGATVLRQTSIPPIPTGDGHYRFCDPTSEPTCVVRQRVLARGLVPAATGLFAYYDFSGVLIAGTDLAAIDLPRVSSIDVTLTVQTSAASGYPAATVVQRVRLPNADINVLVEPS